MKVLAQHELEKKRKYLEPCLELGLFRHQNIVSDLALDCVRKNKSGWNGLARANGRPFRGTDGHTDVG
jgi:hypothetical protein